MTIIAVLSTSRCTGYSPVSNPGSSPTNPTNGAGLNMGIGINNPSGTPTFGASNSPGAQAMSAMGSFTGLPNSNNAMSPTTGFPGGFASPNMAQGGFSGLGVGGLFGMGGFGLSPGKW